MEGRAESTYVQRLEHDRRRASEIPKNVIARRGPRPAQELSDVTGPSSLDGVTVLGPRERRSGRAHVALARRLRPTVAERSGRRRPGGVQSPTVLRVWRASATCPRPVDPEVRRGPRRVPAPRRSAPTSGSKLTNPASSTAWASATTTIREWNPGVVYCSTTGYGPGRPYAQWAGHDDQLPRDRRLPRLLRTRPRRRARAARRDDRRWCGGGMHAVITDPARASCTVGLRVRGAYLECSPSRTGVLSLMSLHFDEFLATGAEPAPRTISSRSVALGRLPRSGRRMDRGSARSNLSSGPTLTGPSRASSGSPTSEMTEVQDAHAERRSSPDREAARLGGRTRRPREAPASSRSPRPAPRHRAVVDPLARTRGTGRGLAQN